MMDTPPPPPKPPVVQPKPNVSRPSSSSIIVNRTQNGNPILKHFQNVTWQHGDVVVDYQVGLTTGVLFLSLKYHRLHPEYIHIRIEKLQKKYKLRVLLILCDIDSQHEQPIRELTKSCLINEITIMVAWTYEEAAMYLQTYKAYENRSSDSIKERVDNDYTSLLRAALTSIKGVNKTDVTTLRTHFGSFASIANASSEELSLCPGIGGVKLRRIKEAFDKPFMTSTTTILPDSQKPPLDKGKGKEKEAPKTRGAKSYTTTASALARIRELDQAKTAAATANSGPRAESPPWDLDLDLNANDDDDAPTGTAARSSSSRPSRDSPEWDLDLDDDDDEDGGENTNFDNDDDDDDAPREKLRGAGAQSPKWDIELDLNGSDDDEPPASMKPAPKKRKPNTPED